MNRQFKPFHARRQTGLTLIEVMVAVVVFSLGIVGLALMQMQGMHFSKDSNSRTQATILARDLADKMRANNEAASDGDYVLAASATAPTTNTCSGGSPCTPAQIAQNDMADWLTRITSELPVGAGEVVSLGFDQYAIRVFWDEARNNTGTPTAGATDCTSTGWQCFELFVVMESEV